jgi:hypothetical protein
MPTHPELGSASWGPLGDLIMMIMPLAAPFLIFGAFILVIGSMKALYAWVKSRREDARFEQIIRKQQAERAKKT